MAKKNLKRINDSALEPLTRREANPSDIQLMMWDVNIDKLLRKRDNFAIRMNTYLHEMLPRKYTVTFNLKRRYFSKMRGLLKRKWKGCIWKVTSLQDTRRIFETTIMKVQRRHTTSQISKQAQEEASVVKEDRKGKKASPQVASLPFSKRRKIIIKRSKNPGKENGN